MEAVAATPGTVNDTVTRWKGFSVQEDASAAAVWEFREGTVTGQVLVYLSLTADQSATIFFPESVSAEDGVYVKEVSGSATGVLYSTDG